MGSKEQYAADTLNDICTKMYEAWKNIEQATTLADICRDYVDPKMLDEMERVCREVDILKSDIQARAATAKMALYGIEPDRRSSK